jgi:site-specific recombinase XerD
MSKQTNLLVIDSEDLPLDRNPAALYLSHLAESGRAGARWSLDLVAKTLSNGKVGSLQLDWSKLRYQHTAAVRTYLADHYSAATANHALSAMRGAIKQAWLLGLMNAEDYMRTVAVDPVRGDTLLSGRELSYQEIKSLMTVCERDRKNAGRRDAAMLTTLYIGGLRREEVTKIELADYDRKTGRLLVHGKENKERVVYMTNEALLVMEDWLAVRGEEGKYFFVPILKAGIIKMRIAKPISPEAIFNMCIKRGNQANVDFSPHDMRRTCASHMLDRGVDLSTVSDYLGHNDPKTTKRYDLRDDERKKEASALLHIPYRGRVGE